MLFIYSPLFSQEMFGIVGSNYAGTNAVQLNPSSMVASPLRWDVNLITMDVFADNNYIYMPGSNTSRFIKTATTYQTLTTDGYKKNEVSDVVLKRFQSNRRKYVNFNLTLRLPSVMIAKGNKAFGFHTAIRSAVSINRLHPSMAEVGYLGMDKPEVQNKTYTAKGGRINTMTWGEFGLSYATMISNTKFYQEKIGITVKYLQGFAAGYFINKKFVYTIYPDSTPIRQDLIIENLDATYGYTDYNTYSDFSSALKGFGGGLDIGYTYEKKNPFRARYKMTKTGHEKRFYKNNYQWKIGISLVDFGMIHFGKDAAKFQFTNNKNDWYRVDTADFNDLYDFDTSMSVRFYTTAEASKKGNAFNMWLPTALSMQADFYVADFFYVNSTIVQRVPHFTAPGVDRVNLFSITPRYETGMLEVALPIVLYQYQDPRIGLAARFGFFSIGTDKLGAFIGKHNYTGLDFYLAIKVMGFKKAKGSKTGENSNSVNKAERKDKPCYHFKSKTKKKKSKHKS